MVFNMPKERSPKKQKSAQSEGASAAMTPFTHLSAGRINSIERFEACLAGAEAFRIKNNRPLITVSYAQSVDGSIATRSRQPIGLSGPESAVLTHQIRACSDAILIGIGTLFRNPRTSPKALDSTVRPFMGPVHSIFILTASVPFKLADIKPAPR